MSRLVIPKYVADRLNRDAQQNSPIGEFIRAQQHLRWGLPLKKAEPWSMKTAKPASSVDAAKSRDGHA